MIASEGFLVSTPSPPRPFRLQRGLCYYVGLYSLKSSLTLKHLNLSSVDLVSVLSILSLTILLKSLTIIMPSAYPAPKSDARLLLISNRLPITIKRSEDGSYDFSMSSGGLVSGLSGLSKSTTFQWYGWPGLEVPEKEAGPLTERLKDEYNAVPVYIDDELADRHYNGFSSKLSNPRVTLLRRWYLTLALDSILWPLFHYHPGEITFDESAWNAYKEANRLFAKAIAKEVQDGDLVWVHDYHLMLLPAMLREEIGKSKTNVKIGFFLHTPFPSSEIYRILPVRNEILLGVLHCDLIGFHTYDYARHFLSSCSRIL